AIAGSQSPGSVARVAYGTKLVSFVVGSIALALSTTMLPAFSRLAAQGNVVALRAMLRKWLIATGVGGTAMAILFALLSRPLVTLAFQRGSFTAEDSAAVATIQAVAVFQLPFYLVGIIAVRLLSATGRNRSLLGITLVSAVVNITADLIFVNLFGLPGIALATVCVYASSSVLSWVLVRRTLGAMPPAADGTVAIPCSPVGATS
ncbi:MAG TPA: lipid II flippase MurJ, partial [Acidimicrobiales bacterium]|nr:lipid II flippase MurJ [Acidimicrobiales bacterium]